MRSGMWLAVAAVTALVVASIAGTAFAVQRIVHLHLVGDPHLVARTVIICAGSALSLATLAVLVGILVGRQRMRPVAALVGACRHQDGHVATLPTASGIAEVDRLAAELNRLIAAERTARSQLAEALDREAVAQAIRQRFLIHLGQELNEPLRRLIVLIDDAARRPHGGSPERLIELRQCAATIEERFQEVIGLTGEAATGITTGDGPMPVQQYVADLADQMRSQAHAKGLTLAVEAPDVTWPIPTRLLTPVMVNLLANALRATMTGGVTLSVEAHAEGTVWTIRDTGPGMAAALAERIADSCRRGEVMPGTAGLGLGLTMAMANLRSLGGRLELVENSPQGVTFRATVPAIQP